MKVFSCKLKVSQVPDDKRFLCFKRPEISMFDLHVFVFVIFT